MGCRLILHSGVFRSITSLLRGCLILFPAAVYFAYVQSIRTCIIVNVSYSHFGVWNIPFVHFVSTTAYTYTTVHLFWVHRYGGVTLLRTFDSTGTIERYEGKVREDRNPHFHGAGQISHMHRHTYMGTYIHTLLYIRVYHAY